MSKSTSDVPGHKQLPNYSTHALEFFRMTAPLVPRHLGIAPLFEEFLADYLADAVKFLLPDNGYLLADHDYEPKMFDLLCLPFPMCALEFAADETLYAPDSGLLQSKKRIALCFDPRKLPVPQFARLDRLVGGDLDVRLPERPLCVMSVYSAGDLWAASVGLEIIDLDEDAPQPLDDETIEQLAGDMAERVLERLGTKRRSKHGLPATFFAFPERARVSGLTVDQAVENLYIDTIDESRVVYEFLAAINCANVGTVDVAAPKMLNQKRLQKGKAPFFPYKVLDLAPTDGGGSGGPGSAGHASPRTHLRRGHLRRLGERFGHKVLWINATVVNARTGVQPGTVYQVRT